MPEGDKVLLKSSQGEIFEVEPEVACMSTLVRNMVDDSGTDEEIPLPNVKTAILSKVIDYCKYHKDSPPEEPLCCEALVGNGSKQAAFNGFPWFFNVFHGVPWVLHGFLIVFCAFSHKFQTCEAPIEDPEAPEEHEPRGVRR